MLWSKIYEDLWSPKILSLLMLFDVPKHIKITYENNLLDLLNNQCELLLHFLHNQLHTTCIIYADLHAFIM